MPARLAVLAMPVSWQMRPETVNCINLFGYRKNWRLSAGDSNSTIGMLLEEIGGAPIGFIRNIAPSGPYNFFRALPLADSVSGHRLAPVWRAFAWSAL